MNCPICKKELEIKTKKVGESATGEAIYNEFAICHDCKKQWNLDKQRAKANAAAKVKAEEKPVEKPAEQPKETPVVSETPETKKPVRKVKKKRPVTPEVAVDPKAEVKPEPTVESVSDAPTRVMPTDELEAKLQEIGLQEEKPRKKKKRPANPEAAAKIQSEAPEVSAESVPAPKKRRPAPTDGAEQPVRKVKKKRPANSETASETASETPSAPKEAVPAPRKKRPASEGQQRRPVSENEIQERPRKKKKRPVETLDDDFAGLSNAFAEEEKEQTYSNIPPKHIREEREKEMRENYQNMLDEDDEEEGGSPIILILIIIILLLVIAAFAGYWFFLR